MIRTLALTALVIGALAATPTLAETGYTPAPGSPERKAMLDAIRPAIEKDLGGPVEFKVSKFRIIGTRALVVADPQRPGGRAIDVDSTNFRGQAGLMDGLRVDAVLVREGKRWTVKAYEIGATDLWYVDHCQETPGLCD